MYIPNFKFPVQFGVELRKKQTQKMRKIYQKITFLVLGEGAMELKSRNVQKAHLRPQLNVHTKFQLTSLIWWGDTGGTALFQCHKGGESTYLPS